MAQVRILDPASYMCVEFVVGSPPYCSEGFSMGTLVFLPPKKTTFLNSNNFDLETVERREEREEKSHSVDFH